MSLVRAKNSKPELAVRKLVHSLGYRFRLHRQDLPGCPDLVFPSRQKVIFVHGCFWHRHRCSMGDRLPKSRTAFWSTKLGENRRRDLRTGQKLRRVGWKALVIWECQTHPAKIARLIARIVEFLDG
jgi:DNA mismatch endonuclease, patch repair protein